MNQATTTTARKAITATCVSLIGAAQTVALVLLVIALFTPQPAVPGVDTDHYRTVWFTSLLAGFLTTFSLALTAILVNIGWARARWLWIPVATLLAVLARYHAMPTWGW